MYSALLYLHNTTRWLLLAAMAISLYRSYKGFTNHKYFIKKDNRIRQYTAAIAHTQLLLGIMLYSQSPLVRYFWQHKAEAIRQKEAVFFSLAHSLTMFISVILITIGSSLAKRKVTDKEKHNTILYWYGIAMLLIIIAIPWPFSPFAMRPLFR